MTTSLHPPRSYFDTGLLHLGAFGLLCFLVGGAWDVSWHIVIGRDTFWSPPHLLLYAGINILLLVLAIAYLIARRWRDTGAHYRGPTAKVLGTPLSPGLVVMGLGALMALTSAPIDNWWHAIFGLDVVIWSPPHLQLIFGVAFAALGLIAALVGEMNAEDPGRLAGEPRPLGGRDLLLVVLGAELLITLNALYAEYAFDIPAFPVWMGAAVTTAIVVGVLFAVSHASGRRFAATGIALAVILIDLAAQTVLWLAPALGRLVAPLVPAWYWPPATFVHYLGVFSLPAAFILDLARARLGERAMLCNIVLGGLPATLTLIASVILWNNLWDGIRWQQELPYWGYVVVTAAGLAGAAAGLWLGRRLRPSANPLTDPRPAARGSALGLAATLAAAVGAAIFAGRALAASTPAADASSSSARVADLGVPAGQISLGSDRLVAGQPLEVTAHFAPGAIGPGQRYEQVVAHYERAGLEVSQPMSASASAGEFRTSIIIPTPGRWGLVILLAAADPDDGPAYDWRPLRFAASDKEAAPITPQYAAAWKAQKLSRGEYKWEGNMLIGKLSVTAFILLLAFAALRSLAGIEDHARRMMARSGPAASTPSTSSRAAPMISG